MDQDEAGIPEEDIIRLVAEARDGKLGAFDQLVRLFQGRIFNLAFRMTNNHADAGDLTQEIFVKLFRSLGKFRHEARFSTWLYSLAANHCRSGMRKIRRIGFFESRSLDETRDTDDARPRLDPPSPEDPPSRHLERRELEGRIGAAVASLPDDLKATLILRDIEGLSYEEIAAALACSVGTVKSRLWRARFRVKDALGGEISHAL